VVLGSYYLQDHNKPYLNDQWNQLEIISIANSISITFGAVYFTINTGSTALNIIILFVVAISNLTFFVVWLKSYLANLKKNQKVQETLNRWWAFCIKRVGARQVKFKIKEARKIEEEEPSTLQGDQTRLSLQEGKNDQSILNL
jgi:hypothetical protein